MKTIGILLSFLFYISFGKGYAQDHLSSLKLTGDTEVLLSELKITIPQLMQKGKVPGLQIALIRDGKTIWTHGFGVKNTESSEKVSDTTVFEAASLTKPLFAYFAMKMIEEKTLDLDTPVIQYFTQQEIEAFFGHSLNKEGFHKAWAEKMTTRHILSHSAGMPHGESGDVYPILFEPGTKYKYSAAGYELLQRVIEKLKDKPLDVLIKMYVLDPLKMIHSSMVWQDDYQSSAANGHDMFSLPQPVRTYTESHAGASLYTTAADYAKFIGAIIQQKGLHADTFTEMLTPQIEVDKDLGLTWSLGFGVQKDNNGLGLWQWGDYGIFRNYILAYPEHKLAVVYLTNSFNGLGINKDIIAHTIGGQSSGITFLEYSQYTSPVAKFCWAILDRGVEVINTQLPELKLQHPEEFNTENIGWLGEEFSRVGKFEESIALLKSNIETNSKDANAYMQMARLYLNKQEHEKASQYYTQAKTLENADPQRLDWGMTYIKAVQTPAVVTLDHLKTLAGKYGPRNIEFRDNVLYYGRDNANGIQYRKLTPLSREIFIMKDLIDFRLQFVLDEHGNPTKIIGLYESGYHDESIRNAE
ncbi:serine hydrolase [Aquimarina sp. 2304DJ70-9]|uniref:serine hydrolase n=1 Tax=Aquimarina penaris TaxID=3231044 RepID=UPI0034625BC1